MSKYIGDMLEENSIDYYRQDFNMQPDIYWAANDEPGRTGMKEIRHIEGLYYFWDYLLSRFPEPAHRQLWPVGDDVLTGKQSAEAHHYGGVIIIITTIRTATNVTRMA